MERGLATFDETAAYFLDEEGEPLEAGTTLKNPAFAETLRLIAEEGSEPFYRGELARAIVETVTGAEVNPGIMTEADLAGYQVKLRDPVCAGYRGRDVCGMGPPSSGGLTVGQILGILEHVDLPGMGPGADFAHHFVEASRLAYADRGLYMADSDFVRMPVAGLLDPH